MEPNDSIDSTVPEEKRRPTSILTLRQSKEGRRDLTVSTGKMCFFSSSSPQGREVHK